MKKVLCILMVLVLLCTPLAASAAKREPITILVDDHSHDEIGARVITDCPYGNGVHDMKSTGWGNLYQGTYPSGILVVQLGSAWQCTKCLKVMVTQYDPLVNGRFGIYGSAPATDPVTQMVYVYTTNIGTYYTSSMAGHSFRYN